jgi:hypothetical protein
MNYNNVYSETYKKISLVERYTDEIKIRMNGYELEMNYPRISEIGKRLIESQIDFLKYYTKVYMKWKNEKNFERNRSNIVKKSKKIGSLLKKIKIDPRLFPRGQHDMLLKYSIMLDTVAATMMSVT